MKGIIGLAVLFLASGLVIARLAAAEDAAPLKGAAAWDSLLGNTITGTTADGVYAEYFAPDGTAVHTDGEGRETGRWTLKQGDVCIVYPTDPDEQVECRRFEVEGTRGTFTDSDGSRYPFAILPGDAEHP